MNYELRFPYTGELVVSEQENVLDAIKINLKIFKDPGSPVQEKAIALCWLIHLVGDIHQPLHSVSLFNGQYPEGDRGGNLFWVRANGSVNLHAFWDGLFGRSTRIRDVLNEVTLLKHNYPREDLAEELDPQVWSMESFELARSKVYLDGHLKGATTKEEAIQLPENYGKESKEIGESQVVLSGYRLAIRIFHSS